MVGNQDTQGNDDPEIVAIGLVHNALKALEPAAQRRVLDYVARKFGLPASSPPAGGAESTRDEGRDKDASAGRDEADAAATDDSDGISPVAQRWIKRSGLSTAALSSIFSIGGDEIDLIAQKVPGDTKKDRMHSVLLLKAMASYLASGAPRTAHKDAKEACVHYDGWDTANFAAHLKSFAPEMSGSKTLGYTLNARGLSAATELIKTMIAEKSE